MTVTANAFKVGQGVISPVIISMVRLGRWLSVAHFTNRISTPHDPAQSLPSRASVVFGLSRVFRVTLLTGDGVGRAM